MYDNHDLPALHRRFMFV